MAEKKTTDNASGKDNAAGKDNATGKKVAAKTTATKKAVTKKAVKKKTAAKKATMPQVDTVPSPTQTPKESDMETLSAIKAMVEEMRQDNINRDQQTASLVQEIRQGFTAYSEYAVKQDSEREQEMTKLYQSLQSAFANVEHKGNKLEDRNMLILKALSDSIMKDHEQTLKEVQEQEKLQDKKLEHLTFVQQQRSGRNRWIAIPGMVIGILAIIYMFFVVTIMEDAMTSMSKDMHNIQFAVANMSQKMDAMREDTSSMSTNTSSMNENMDQLNRNMGQLSRDMNVMTHNVSPTMQGFRDMMPWAP